MSVAITAKWDRSVLALPDKKAVKRALRKAGATALRDMRAEASKRIKARKRIKGRYITRAMSLRRPKGGNLDRWVWAVELDGDPVPLVAYPHRQTRKGVSVEVNRGKRTLVAGSFVATMKSGHKGVFRRQGKERLPIEELRGSRPVDALLHKGEADAVAERGGRSLTVTFARLLPLEIGK